MIIGGYLPLSLSDYPGTPAAVIFTQGCNWKCPFCHNRGLWETSGESELDLEDVLQQISKRRSLLKGVVITGGEPTLHSDLEDVCHLLRDQGFKVKLDTNGSRPQIVEKLLTREAVDYVAMDIKAPWSKYCLLSGREDLDIDAVKRTVALLAKSQVDHEFRTTWPPDLLDKEDVEVIETLLPDGSTFTLQEYRQVAM